ncbi:putative wall-associated receptor kinase-like 16 isoform X2 [Silene latifolia]
MGQAQYKKKNKGNKKFEAVENFTKNGGILLEKQIALSQGQHIRAVYLKIFSEEELKNATNGYDPDLVVGSYHEGVVYRAILDDRTVAIKIPQERGMNPELTDLFLTDVSIGMVVCHANMVKIYGCCLETSVPMMVYEFYPNKDLSQYLHGDLALEKPMKWSGRLRAAADIAYALSYMHNALSKPVVHRDVKSFGILLDSSFHAKLGNFGYSVSITPGKKDQIWPVHGTMGYIDPEYIETREVTEKCDVYSFGVLMLELLTARDPIKMARCGEDLPNEFVYAAKRIGANEMIDKIVLEEGNMDEIERFVRLALACVAKKGEERPTMICVVAELWQIQEQDSKRRENSTK